MAFIAAKCPQCGANIKVDQTHDAGICPHCGTAFVTEKAINNYNVNYNVTKIIGSVDEEDLLDDAMTLYQFGQKVKALDVFRRFTSAVPKAFVGWYYTAKIIDEIFDDKSTDAAIAEEMTGAVDVAYKLAKDKEEFASIKPLYIKGKQMQILNLQRKNAEYKSIILKAEREKHMMIGDTTMQNIKYVKKTDKKPKQESTGIGCAWAVVLTFILGTLTYLTNSIKVLALGMLLLVIGGLLYLVSSNSRRNSLDIWKSVSEQFGEIDKRIAIYEDKINANNELIKRCEDEIAAIEEKTK